MNKLPAILIFMLCTLMVLSTVFAATPTDLDDVTTTDTVPKDNENPEENNPAVQPFEIIKLESMGTNVALIQIRLGELGYFSYRPTGQFGKMSRDATIAFQEQNSLAVDGTIGESTFEKLFENSLTRTKMTEAMPAYSGPSAKGTPKTLGISGDWNAVIVPLFPVSSTCRITDLNSDITFNVKRVGGENHAEVVPLTDKDYEDFKKSFGGGATYEKRAVLAELDGKQYAASLFGFPHGQKDSDSPMNGYTCLYFSGSLSRVLALPDPEHNEMVAKAGAR